MNDLYNLDGIRTQLTYDLNKKRAFVSLWESVELNHKKDGTPFQNMAKNFTGAYYRPSNHTIYTNQYEICVHEWVNGCGYVTDSIDCWLYSAPENGKPENIDKRSGHYLFDYYDIVAAIDTHVKKLKKDVARLEQDLGILDKTYNEFKEAYALAFENLKKACASTYNGGLSSMEYYISETVKKRYPYC